MPSAGRLSLDWFAPATGAAERASGRPLSCDCIGPGLPKAESLACRLHRRRKGREVEEIEYCRKGSSLKRKEGNRYWRVDIGVDERWKRDLLGRQDEQSRRSLSRTVSTVKDTLISDGQRCAARR